MLWPTRNKRLNLLIWLKTLGFGPVAVTCSGKTDGGGAQVHAVLSIQAFCRRYGVTYTHTPFTQIEHTSGPQEVERWETTFALGTGHELATSFGLPVIKLKTYARRPALWFQRIIVAIPHAHDYTDHAGETYEWLLARRGKKTFNQRLEIAIHLRRGDVSPTRNADRYTPDNKILDLIEMLKRALQHVSPQPEFHIYSQGIAEDFEAYARLGCRMHLNDDALNDLLSMSKADILVIAKSSFSYVAGLLNQGIVIYEPFWHRPVAHWVKMSDRERLNTLILSLPLNDAGIP
jgi:hypothetical protein